MFNANSGLVGLWARLCTPETDGNGKTVIKAKYTKAQIPNIHNLRAEVIKLLDKSEVK
ncbi:MAG: hypothetical protein RR322_02825 [Oscillospiraceae bacterium]